MANLAVFFSNLCEESFLPDVAIGVEVLTLGWFLECSEGIMVGFGLDDVLASVDEINLFGLISNQKKTGMLFAAIVVLFVNYRLRALALKRENHGLFRSYVNFIGLRAIVMIVYALVPWLFGGARSIGEGPYLARPYDLTYKIADCC